MDLTRILGIGALALTVSGWRAPKKEAPPQVDLSEIVSNLPKYNGKKVIVKGLPISVQYGDGGLFNKNSLAIVIGTEDKKKSLLCYAEAFGPVESYTKIKALIDAEINDGDKEPIAVKGIMRSGSSATAENTLYTNSVSVGDYNIRISQSHSWGSH